MLSAFKAIDGTYLKNVAFRFSISVCGVDEHTDNKIKLLLILRLSKKVIKFVVLLKISSIFL